jgi:hypothetical protein
VAFRRWLAAKISMKIGQKARVGAVAGHPGGRIPVPGLSRATGWHQGGSSAPSLASGAAILPGVLRTGQR